MVKKVFSGIESLYTVVKGHRAHYLKAGSGPPVVLLHGGASDCRDWLGTMATLAPRFTLYAPDLIGFGRSERKEAGYFLSDFIGFTEDFVNALGLGGCDLVGHSFGGRIGAGVAAGGRAKVRRLVLVDSSGLGKISGLGGALFTGFRALRRLTRRPQPYPRFLAKDGEDYEWIGDAALRALSTPTLLVWKRRDPYLPVSLPRKAVQIMPAAQLKILPGIGHAPGKQNVREFARLLADFLGGD